MRGEGAWPNRRHEERCRQKANCNRIDGGREQAALYEHEAGQREPSPEAALVQDRSGRVAKQDCPIARDQNAACHRRQRATQLSATDMGTKQCTQCETDLRGQQCRGTGEAKGLDSVKPGDDESRDGQKERDGDQTGKQGWIGEPGPADPDQRAEKKGEKDRSALKG